MTMEIKQGDKVRVSKDAPRIYTPDWVDEMFDLVLKVKAVEDGNAMVVFEKRAPYKTVLTAIPTKYLIKVEDEAKAKYKVGDKVRVLGHALLEGGVYTIIGVEHRERLGWYYQINIHEWYPEIDLEPYTEPTAPTIKVGDRVCCYNVLHLKGSKKEDYMGIVTSITDMGITVQLDNGGMMFSCCESDLELVQPKKQTEAEKTKIKDDKLVFPITFDLSDSYWDAYTADLARDIAVKSMEKSYGCDPERIADYAVSVAKAVMEGLKRK